jgi:predicted oxidoreductase
LRDLAELLKGLVNALGALSHVTQQGYENLLFIVRRRRLTRGFHFMGAKATRKITSFDLKCCGA